MHNVYPKIQLTYRFVGGRWHWHQMSGFPALPPGSNKLLQEEIPSLLPIPSQETLNRLEQGDIWDKEHWEEWELREQYDPYPEIVERMKNEITKND